MKKNHVIFHFLYYVQSISYRLLERIGKKNTEGGEQV